MTTSAADTPASGLPQEERAAGRTPSEKGGGMRDPEARARHRRGEILGNAFTWLCGGALGLNLLLVVAILALLLIQGGDYFWQKPLVEVELKDGRKLLGEVWNVEEIPASGTEPTQAGEGASALPGAESEAGPPLRFRMKIGNRDVTGLDFAWTDDSDVVTRTRPADAVLLERLEWGNFYGYPVALRKGDEVLASGREEAWKVLGPLVERKRRERAAIEEFEKDEIGDVNYRIEQLRLAERRLDLEAPPPVERERRSAALAAELAPLEAEYHELAEKLSTMRTQLVAETLEMATAGGETKRIPVGNVVHAYRPNEMSTAGKLGLYATRIGEFVADDPRESNTEGGIFPAIFGTVMMVFIMSFAVAPLGVLAAVYLREYARQGPLVRLVRIAVNNLAGVPSIVFGVFGLGFFVYLVGGSIDRLFYPEALPTPTFGTGGILWASLTLALLTVPVVIVAAEEGLAAVPAIVRHGSLALGATKFETTWRVVVPAAAPGILTGMILAMARAAGEVAPLMIVGMVKLAPALPLDGRFPFVHLERKFMHLGFHIFDVGFQSPNVEATKPLVFATALLLIAVVTVMNLAAISLRNHLRRKYAGSAV